MNTIKLDDLICAMQSKENVTIKSLSVTAKENCWLERNTLPIPPKEEKQLPGFPGHDFEPKSSIFIWNTARIECDDIIISATFGMRILFLDQDPNVHHAPDDFGDTSWTIVKNGWKIIDGNGNSIPDFQILGMILHYTTLGILHYKNFIDKLKEEIINNADTKAD